MLTRFPFGSEETKRRKEKNERSIRNKQELEEKKFAQRENFKKEGRGQVSWKSVRKTGRGFNTPALVSVAREGR